MPSFKELMQSFLYEDVEDDDEDEEDFIESAAVKETPKVQTSTPVSNPVSTPVSQPVSQPVYTQPVSQPVSQPVYASESLNTSIPAAEPVKASIFSGLDMGDISKPEQKTESRQSNTPYHYDRRKISKPMRRSTPDYEYEAVISPIFGNMEDDEKELEAIHDAVNLPRPTEELEMTSVISPMYGSGKIAGIESEPVDHIPAYQPKQKTAKKKKAAPTRDEKKPAYTAAPSSSKPIRDVADLLTREPVSAPAEKKEPDQSEQLSLEQDK